ncbi:Phox homologous domain [Phytophthora cinnamomi]|uniref:Phox homologous domain n=1 Tax=Phytophthora cinnamomi TaxID=4785 RepID=UPI0035593F2A|nr:Phox homologous domain [Phytophthora cinnamomi]
MPTLTVEDLAVEPGADNRQLVERHVTESFAASRHRSFDDTLGRSQPLLGRSQHKLRFRSSMPAVLRLSSELGGSRFGLIPGHEVTDTSVRFLGVTRVDDHCEFRLNVTTSTGNFVLQKRYSQFRDLRQQLLLDGKAACASADKRREGYCRSGACQQLAQQLAMVKFPRRKMKFKLHRDDDVKTARERQAQLQYFVEMVLAVYRTAPKRQVRCCVNSQCRVLQEIRAFLDIKELCEDELPDWKSVSNGMSSGDDVPILDTPPSTTSPVSSPCNDAPSSYESPIPVRGSAMCLEELYTITEDTENPHI